MNDIQRGAKFHCQLAGSNQLRPLGLYTNLSSLQSRLLFYLGLESILRWTPATLLPVLSPRTLHSKEWTRVRSFTPLLPRHWASSSGGGVQSHSWTLKTLPSGLERQLTQRILVHCFLHSHSGIHIRSPLPSFSSASPSKQGLFTHWREGNLTRPLLVENVSPDMSAKYFSGAAPPSGGTPTSALHLLGDVCGLRLRLHHQARLVLRNQVTEGTWRKRMVVRSVVRTPCWFT